MADEKGRVIVINCSSFVDSTDIIKGIIESDELCQEQISCTVSAYSYRIQNKYYTSDIQLCCVKPTSLPAGASLDTEMSFEAVIIIFDISQSASFEDVKSWIPYLDSKDPSVMLLLNTCQGDNKEGKALSREDVIKWCIQHSFELVDLVDDNEDKETQNDFLEKTGLERVKEALNCADWPNIQMRDSPLVNQHNNGEAVSDKTNENKTTEECSNTNSNTVINENPSVHSADSLLPEELGLLNDLRSDDAEGESFEELFQKMKFMKDRATAMPDNERKAYAEKVAIAFWKALGGDDDEVLGLSSDENN